MAALGAGENDLQAGGEAGIEGGEGFAAGGKDFAAVETIERD